MRFQKMPSFTVIGQAEKSQMKWHNAHPASVKTSLLRPTRGPYITHFSYARMSDE